MDKSLRYEHPLDGAEARVRRARQLIGTLKRQIRKWAELHREHVTVEPRPDGTFEWSLDTTDGTQLTKASVTMDEIVYNLRSALDYSVYVMARIGAGGIHVGGTQFPIEDSPSKFKSRVTGKTADGKRVAHFLKKVPKEGIHLIEQMQPYNGVEWTRDLRELSNPGKHRHLANLRSEFRATNVLHEIIALDPDTGLHALTVRYDGEITVFYEDGRDVIDALTALHREVEAVVRLFKDSIRVVWRDEPPAT